jgi:hypothetical protein
MTAACHPAMDVRPKALGPAVDIAPAINRRRLYMKAIALPVYGSRKGEVLGLASRVGPD